MGDIHQLILTHGRDRARDMVPEKMRPLIDVAAEVLADEAQHLGITYSGFCLTGFPHKRLADDVPWEKRGARVTLLVEPGRLPVNGKTKLFGVPYGARARMILIYLQTQALQNNSRTVELGRSMRAWLDRMGVSVGGETAKSFREQSMRISACSIKFFWTNEGADRWKNASIVDDGLMFSAENPAQGSLWDDTVTLNETFYTALRDHPVPLLESAVRQLKDRSLSLDVYVWLAYRLHVLERPTPITWAALYSQFGAGFKLVRQFKGKFVEALGPALAAYPDARVDLVEDGSGLVLFPSKPPVGKLLGAG